MASNSDNSGKGQAKPGAEGPKKPSALIDLKASEVDVRAPRDAAGAKPAATVAEAAAKAAGGAAAASVGATAGPAAESSPAAASPSGSAPTAVVAPPRAASGGLRGAATHLAAGLAGGLLALLGADALLPHLRPAEPKGAGLPAAVEARLRNLEQIATRPVPTELTQRLTSTEARLVEIDRIARSIGEQQAKLAGETQSIGARLSSATPNAAADERLAKLEEILASLSAAAASDPQKGRIPQLAAITAKLADLESALATQIAQLRKSVTQEVDSRLVQSTDAAQAARAGTQRLDRELAGVKTEAAQTIQRIDAVKLQADRMEIALQAVRDDTVWLKSELARELQQVARSTDVNKALAPVTRQLSLLEQNVQGVVRSEGDRRASVERIVTALELGNLKRAIDRGAAFAAELAEVRRVAGAGIDLSALERHKDRGVPALAELEREFRTLAFTVIDADRQPASAHWTDRLIASAQSVVRVRRVDQGADDKGIEAQVARIEASLKGGRLAEVVAEAARLSEKARAPARAWLDKVEARAAVDRAIAAVEQELKASLGAQSQSGKKG